MIWVTMRSIRHCMMVFNCVFIVNTYSWSSTYLITWCSVKADPLQILDLDQSDFKWDDLFHHMSWHFRLRDAQVPNSIWVPFPSHSSIASRLIYSISINQYCWPQFLWRWWWQVTESTSMTPEFTWRTIQSINIHTCPSVKESTALITYLNSQNSAVRWFQNDSL